MMAASQLARISVDLGAISKFIWVTRNNMFNYRLIRL